MARKNKKKAAAQAQQKQVARPRVPKAVQTAQNLQKVSARLNQRRQFLENKAMQSRKVAIAKKKQGNKRQAILHLRRMKQFEREALRLDDLIMQVETQQLAIESAGVMTDAVGAIRAGLQTQKELASKLDPDSVAEDLDDVQELMADVDEVNEILGESMGLEAYDDSELLKELEDGELDEASTLETGRNLDIDLDLPDAPINTSTLPAVPTGTVKSPLSADDDEALRQLEAELL
mmetsp:Transcript_9664/g.11003  ORF Transcript_9664/g.11003 Transcript_9664/m.11003 type:complete len:234 (+) Transcript_9664:257-958(+)|eukprot:CAMPEP_0184023192 /NCGR_PEP_ID=MMETSP0954-20121128/11185_1 /TAXON_ID=627963 /ORGANISM="Aplanochytrium sp, Strain PBS07" /LENGTH=233 /DNA_ID=CAMNT_0026305971 /DNA_START=284 /DNA_END=985 /DNA_ORIENTATION=+